MYDLIAVGMGLTVVALVFGYYKIKQASYGRSRCRFCGKALKRTTPVSRSDLCHHCGRSQTESVA
jgi:rRNA maturation endonuclease Nob1